MTRASVLRFHHGEKPPLQECPLVKNDKPESALPEPDKSVGGTFHYDKRGAFVRHEPPTQPHTEHPAPASTDEGAAPSA